MAKPKLIIKNFSGMGDDGVYYLEGMSPRKLNGQSILTASWFNQDFITSSTTGFSGLGTLNAMTRLRFDGTLNASDNNSILAVETDEIFLFNSLFKTNNIGEIHTIATPTSQPDIKTTTNSNVIYTGANDLGIGRVFKATGGSTTTIVVAGEDFGANYDYAAGDKLYNITKNEEYEIDTGGVGTTTLTLISGTANEANDYFIVFNDDFKDFGTTSITGNHFKAQLSPTTWIRQIKLLGDEYWILNGNYIASLNIDEDTFAAQAKQLPNNTQAVCFDINQDKMLVGGEYNALGKLMLWDTHSDGWLSIFEIDDAPSAIRAYKNGWIVVIRGSIYFTDGYQIKLMDIYPDLADVTKTLACHYNGIEIYGENIILSINSSSLNRPGDGNAIYNPQYGWSFIPYYSDTNSQFQRGTNGALFKTSSATNAVTIFSSGTMSVGTKKSVINILTNNGGPKDAVAMFYIKLPNKMKINAIELNLAPKYDASNIAGNVSVVVSYSDARRFLWTQVQIGENNTTTVIKNVAGVTLPASIGDEIVIMEGDSAGQRTYIESITNPGEATEAWTVSPALTSAPEDSSQVIFLSFDKSESKTVDATSMPDNLMYNVSNFYSDKLFFEIRQEVSGVFPLDIHSINIH